MDFCKIDSKITNNDLQNNQSVFIREYKNKCNLNKLFNETKEF